MKKKRPSVEAQAAAASQERKKMIAMTVTLVVLGVAFASTKIQQQKYADQELQELPGQAPEITQTIAVPEIDIEGLQELAADSTETDRVDLDRPAVDLALANTRTLLDAHFEPMQGRELDSGMVRELFADPAPNRGELFRLRGSIEQMAWEQRADGKEQYRGRLKTDFGESVFFVVGSVPQFAAEGDHLRMDGLFVKLLRDEVDGEWIDGPLFVGSRAISSYANLGKVTELSKHLFIDVRDADIENDGGRLTDYTEERYELLAFARDTYEPITWNADPKAQEQDKEAAGDSVWDSAPLMDNELLNEVFRDGSEWRGRPVRIPVSKLMGIRNITAGENPARLSQVSNGWIGNFQWTGPSPVVQFEAPFPVTMPLGSYIRANGFFFCNARYERSNGALSSAPFLVLQAIEVFEPEKDYFVHKMLFAICGVVVALGLLFWLMLMRDSRRSKELREELVRRRRKRSAKQATPSA